MDKGTFHPNAYLSNIKNTKRGLRARTRILIVLEKRSADAGSVGKETGMSYGVAVHHLKLLMAEGLANWKDARPHVWLLNGVGQKRLANSG